MSFRFVYNVWTLLFVLGGFCHTIFNFMQLTVNLSFCFVESGLLFIVRMPFLSLRLKKNLTTFSFGPCSHVCFQTYDKFVYSYI